MAVSQSTAHFVKRNIEEPLVPFLEANHDLNLAHTEERLIAARRINVGHLETIQTQGFAAVNLQEFFLNDCDCEDDDQLRNALGKFWRSSVGKTIMGNRFGASANELHIFPTHVTRRKAPPDHMALVHIDYPATHDMETLWREWQGRWQNILPTDFTGCYKLRGVLTVWVAVSNVTDYPLWVADAETVSAENNNGTVVYKVGSSNRSSVGVYYDPNIVWYTVEDMKRYDAWIFDTQRNPHVAVSLQQQQQQRRGGTGTTSRRSAEVRCLVVEAV
jgi:hypothetical protein